MVGRVFLVVTQRAREGVALLLSNRVLYVVVEYMEVLAMLMWVRGKIGGEFWVFDSIYGPGSEEEREAIWNELSGCVEERKRGGCHEAVLGDLNARVGKEAVFPTRSRN